MKVLCINLPFHPLFINFAGIFERKMTQRTTEQLFRTPVKIATPLCRMGVEDRFVFLGSCFAEHIGARFLENRLQTIVNPLGVVYNPMSIVRLLEIHATESERDFSNREGMWHTWLGDSSLSRPSFADCEQTTCVALKSLHDALLSADYLFLTLGTTHYYSYKGEVVANCHRFPAADFEEAEMEVGEMVTAMDQALVSWMRKNPHLKVVFTVSPYRYAKYGFHESQLSKARLLLAVDELCHRHPDKVTYFPAYEIVLDELRDYRFYAEDMLHPSSQAVLYIWQRLAESWMDQSVLDYLERWKPIHQALEHRPLNASDPAYEVFRQRTEAQLAALRKDYPFLPI